MEFIGGFLAYFIFFMAIAIIAGVARNFFQKRKIGIFQKYVAENIGEMPEGQELFSARQKRGGAKLDIALFILETSSQIAIIQDNKGEDIKHKLYVYSDLVSSETTDTVITRGVIPKQYSYERTLTLGFIDDKSYRYKLETPSNKNGDKNSNIVKNMFAPWEEKLNKILG